MCIAYLALNTHPDWPLLVAANRDEFHARPARPAGPWAGHPDVIAGIDLDAGGTWLGVTRQGRFGFLTNYREPGTHIDNAPSRGALVSDYLTASTDPVAYASQVSHRADAYNGFNLIVGNLNTACYLSNRAPNRTPLTLGPGRYVVSNHLLDTPWPKAERLRQAFEQLDMDGLTRSLRVVFATLKDTTAADDASLPDTGLDKTLERLLSSPFIISPDYGTRCSSVIAIHRSGRALFSEISYDPQGRETQRHDWPFSVSPAPEYCPA